MNNSLVKIDHKEYGLEKVQAENVERAFMPKIAEREGLKQIYAQIITQEITLELIEHAKSARLKLVKVRTGIAEVHKTQKAFFRAAGLYVDAWKNKETLPVTQMEEKLMEIECYYENIERQRLDKVESERILKLHKYEVDPEHYDLRNMPEPGFNQLLEASKIAYEQRVNTEKEAERKRLAEEKAQADEAQRNKVENERLKKDAEKRDKIIDNERLKRKKLEDDLKEKTEAESRAKLVQEEKEAMEYSAPDRHKLEQLALSIVAMKMPEVKSKKAKSVIKDVVILLNKTSNFIKKKSITI